MSSRDLWKDDWRFKFDELVKHGMSRGRACIIAVGYAEESDNRAKEVFLQGLKDSGYLDELEEE